MLGGKCYDYFLHSMEELVDGQWVYRTSMATPRAQFDAVIAEDKIFAVGGYSAQLVFAEPQIEAYNIADNSWQTVTVDGFIP